jgi:signal transduction histidine kinase
LTNQINSQTNTKLIDSINSLRKFSTDPNLSSGERLKYSKIVSDISVKTENDSIILRANRDLSYNYLINEEFELFKTVSLENLELAKKLKDYSAIAYTNKNLGWYYYEIADDNTTSYQYYIEALEFFNEKRKLNEKLEILFAIAIIQDLEKDYLGSEQNAIEALRILNKLDTDDKTLDRYNLLNLLGTVSYKLENYEEAIEYHSEALKLTKKIDDDIDRYSSSQNDLALLYRAKKDYDKALNIYRELIGNKKIKEDDIIFYALILDNYAFTRFLEGDYDFKTLEKDFKKAYKIADSINDPYTKLAASIDLAKFYKANKELDSSLIYAETSYEISRDIPINELYLESMYLLANLTKGEESKNYLDSYIKLSDSLLKKERKSRNKYARIKYDTDEIEAENKQISKENLYLAILSIGLLFSAILIYVVISQRAKNRKLKLMQVQQKANEDIYNLMLGQQDKVDEARAKEKTRVSKELHDGVLGRLFGTRLSLDSINFNEGKEAMMTRAKYIAQLQEVEQDIRKISHDLNTDFVSGSGFMDIVTELIENQTQAYSLQHEFNYTDDISWDLVSNKTKINFYRIIQESMQNIYKHANANIIKISISLEKDVICLDIIDDGDGFDTSKKIKGIGLKNMRSRVEDIKGDITFTSQSGNGAQVNVKIPYTNQSA